MSDEEKVTNEEAANEEAVTTEDVTAETTEGPVAGVGILVAAFTQEMAADEALKGLKEAKKKNGIKFDDAAVIRQDANGKVHYHETGDMSTGKGAAIGALIGGVVGILGGPAAIAVGAGVGALAGAGIALGDAGFDDQSLEEIGAALKPGTSALVAITSHAFLKAVQDNVDKADVQAAVQQLADTISAQLDAGKDAVYGLAITEEGIAASVITADDKSAEAMGFVVTEEGMAFAGGVVTEEGAVVVEGVVTEEGAVVAGVVAEVSDDEAEAADAEEEEKA